MSEQHSQPDKYPLNLPKTDFPMKANLPQREPQVLQFWQNLNIYQQLREIGKIRPRFVLHDGPPYANARPHLGTALNKILKDIVIKSKTLSGYDAPYVPGWDCHGLPIELNVEKKIGKVGENLSLEAFRHACREYAQSQIELQSTDFQRLGVIGDWQNPYSTMQYSYEADIIRALAKIIANGHLLRGFKPVHWCTACGSALAEAEVEYADKTSPAIDVGFLVTDINDLAQRFQIEKLNHNTMAMIPIWTTTPWTLPANQAVTLHPEFEYVLLRADWVNDRKIALVLVNSLLDAVLERYQLKNHQVLATVNGELLEGLVLKHPFLEREVPIILGDHVTAETGTGNVHTAPAHGQEDYVVGQRYQLPIDNPVDARSCFYPEVPLVGGLHVFKANEVIIEQLNQNGHLLHFTTIHHSYPHCWRHKLPLIFRATPQWFISMEQQNLRNQAIEAIEHVQWLPSWGKTRIERMLEVRPDWCISRQRVWGTPLALFVHKVTGLLHPDTQNLLAQVALRVEEQGIDAWYALDPKELLAADADDYEKVTDVLDVWFDSGVSHYCILNQRSELAFPADLYLEGSDQHRGWFQTSLLTSLAINNSAPFKMILTHGYVIDIEGRKMSKSLGNVILPYDVANRLGADVLRLWVASVDYRGDMNVSDEILKRSADAYRRIRNTTRFLLANLYDFNPEHDLLAVDELVELDRWALKTTINLQQEIQQAYAEYHFPTIYQKLHNFCSVLMGSFYLDIIKDRLYTSRTNGFPRRSAQTVLYYIVEALTRWLAPILTFTAEEIWRYIPGPRTDSVFLTTWYEQFPTMPVSTFDDTYWQEIMSVRDEVNKVLEQYRKQGEIGSALDTRVELYAEIALLEKLSTLEDELRFVLITSDANVHLAADRDESAQSTDRSDLWVKVIVSPDAKCARCWQRRDDVGDSADYPDLCGRCVSNIFGEGEKRYYA